MDKTSKMQSHISNTVQRQTVTVTGDKHCLRSTHVPQAQPVNRARCTGDLGPPLEAEKINAHLWHFIALLLKMLEFEPFLSENIG